jgi:hypothetical protein
MWRRSKHYLRENWGAPFVLAFIALLVASAVLLSYGRSSTANNIAVYAFYALVLGVVLQIASYVKFGESEEEEPSSYTPSSWAPPRSWRPGRRTVAVVVVAIVIVASLVSVIYYKPSTSSHTTSTTHTTHTTIGPLVAGLDFIAPSLGPNNSVQITIGINETGGLHPYNFTAYWSDGVNQTNNVGVFIRSFFSNQSTPNSAKVVVTSSDGQSATVLVQIPAVNRTTSITSTTTSSTSTSTSSTTTVPMITFVESGLPAGSLWTLTLPGSEIQSTTSEIVFNYFAVNSTKYSVSGPYDEKNFKWAFIPSPQSGTIEANASVRIDIEFSNQTVPTPTSSLFLITKPVVALTTSANSEQLNVAYLNTFPDQVQAIVFATIKNNSTGSISVTTATIDPVASGEQSALLIFAGLSPGNYSASMFVESPGGVQLSQTTNSTFTLVG